MPVLHLLSELYFPEETSTGYYVTNIAEAVAEIPDWQVGVICAQPTYSKRGIVAAKQEKRNGVTIHRCWSTRFNKNHLPGKVLNWATFAWSVTLRCLRQFRRGDLVLVVTNPPLLPWIVVVCSKIKGSVPVLLVHDLYPDVLVPTGILRSERMLYRLLDRMQTRVFLSFRSIIVLGRDMKKRICAKDPRLEAKIQVIPNWTDPDEIPFRDRECNPVREKLGLADEFVVQFSGNLGRSHGIDDLLEAARVLRDEPIHFLVFGWGAARDSIESGVAKGGLEKVHLLDPCRREELGVYLNACDLFLFPFRKGMSGISVPSRLYNVIAAGNPVIAVTDDDSELALIVREQRIGSVIEPGDTEELANKILFYSQNRELLEPMRIRARDAAVNRYSMDQILSVYQDYFIELASRFPPSSF